MSVIATHEYRHASEHVLQDGLIVLQVTPIFHPQLGQRAATNHRDLVKDAGTHQAAGDGQGVDRSTTKAFDIHARCQPTLTHLRHGFGQITAAALITIADCFLAAVEEILDRLWVDLFLRE
jgi:hypothetical protein